MWGNKSLLAALAEAGARRSSDFGPTDIAKGCWAFSKLRFVSEPVAMDFWSAMSREAPRTVRSARFVDVSMMAWAFAMTGYVNNDFFAELATVTRVACDTLPPRSLASISWSCARARYVDRRLCTELTKRAMATTHEFGAHDISAFCWAFAVLGEADKPLFEALAARVIEADLLARLSPPLAAELAWGFAAAGVQHGKLFKELENLCRAHINDLETEDVAGFAWAFSVMGWP